MAVRLIQPYELLVLADELAGREAGPGKPRTINLRRAISSAYYALFHRLTQHTATRLLADELWTPKHTSVARWVTHIELRKLSDAANGRGNRALVDVLDPVDPRLSDLCQSFIDLQDARHGADYDDYFAVWKYQTLEYVDAARRALVAARELHGSGEKSYQRFLGLAVGGTNVAKSR
ncbi:MAG: hypothetical protein ACOYEV_02135 [Candidatus Nanopelagicales bacterium]